MSKDNDSRTVFTFRVASDDMKRVAMQLSSMTIQSKTVGEAIDNVQSNIDKKRKELRSVNRRIDARKKVLVRLGKRLAKDSYVEESSKMSKDSILQSTEGVFEASFTTEEATVILSDMLSSPRKRKRVAGVWDDVELDLPEFEVKKRARVDITSYMDDEPKENIAPESQKVEAGGTNE